MVTFWSRQEPRRDRRRVHSERLRSSSDSEWPHCRKFKHSGARWHIVQVFSFSYPLQHITLQQLLTTTRADPDVITVFLFFSLSTFFFLCGKKQGTTSGKNVCFLKGREQTWFCGTLGNRSKRLSSGKLWANINEAFKLEKKRQKREAYLKFELLEGYWSWIGCCKIVTLLLKSALKKKRSHFSPMF